jgi:DNA polymerase-4
MNTTAILHLDLDTFFVSVERLINTELLNKPLLVGGLGDRGVVAACSYETRKFGVHSGMSMKVARNLCPEATVIKGNASTYTKYSHLITEIIKSEVPSFEKASVDEFYADLTGMDRFFGCYRFAKELRTKIIKETGLPIPLGGIVVKRELPFEVQQKVERVLRKSVEYAFANPNSSADYVKYHAQEMEKAVVDAHINLYVNDFSVSLGIEGREAVQLLFEKSGKEYSSIFVE